MALEHASDAAANPASEVDHPSFVGGVFENINVSKSTCDPRVVNTRMLIPRVETPQVDPIDIAGTPSAGWVMDSDDDVAA